VSRVIKGRQKISASCRRPGPTAWVARFPRSSLLRRNLAIKPLTPADRMAQRIAALRKRMNRELDEILSEYLATVPPEQRRDHPTA